MTAATLPTVGGAKPWHQNSAPSLLIFAAFCRSEAVDLIDLHRRMRQQVVDVPMTLFGGSQMPPDARFHRAHGTAGIDIGTGRKAKSTLRADCDPGGSFQLDNQLIGN